MGERQKFSLKKYKKDRKKCYDLSRSGINLESLSHTEERISSQMIKSNIRKIYGSTETQRLCFEADNCIKKDALGLCTLPVKDRKESKCQYCEVNI